MRVAMGLAAGICLFLGIYPAPLYALLPHPVHYVPYTPFHVIGMLQLLMFGALAFTMLVLSGYYPPELRAVNLDTDWFARMLGRRFIGFCGEPLTRIANTAERWVGLAAARSTTLPAAAGQAEKRADAFFHSGLTSIPNRLFLWGRSLKTEDRQLSWNLLYILAPFVVLLIVALFWIGRR
jgi:hypothetical protein